MSADPAIVVDGSSFRRVVDALGDGLAGRASDVQAYARCPVPAHDDHKPSLSVTWKPHADKGGRTMVHCQRGCDYRDVLAVLSLEPHDLYDTPPFESKRPGGARRARKPKASRPRGELKPKSQKTPASSDGDWSWELVDTYTYVDADGVRVFDVRRWADAPVKFTVRTYTRDGMKVAVKKAPALERRVLLHLPDVLTAVTAGDPVFVCEGEKDAEAVRAAGVVATTNPFGAAVGSEATQKWLPQYTEALRSAHVVLVADRDDPAKGRPGDRLAGYRHVLYVASELDGVAASVRIVEPPEPTPADAYDHLVTRGRPLDALEPVTAEELTGRIAAADATEKAARDPERDFSHAASAPAEESPPADVRPAGESARVYEFPTSHRDDADIPPGGGGGGSGAGGGGDEPEYQRVIVRDRFRATDRGLYRIKVDAANRRELWSELLPARVRLASRVVEDLADGAEPTMTHVDLIASRDGEEHPLRSVDRRRWESCGWVSELPWPCTFQDTPSGRSTLRNAVIATSDAVPLTTMYGSLGWQKIAGRWCYVHAGGAVDANGPVDDIRVHVPPPLEPFALPPAPESAEDLRAAVLASTAVLDVLPARLAAPLLGAAYRACLGFSRVTVMPVGAKAGGKTGLAALAAQHYAPTARHDNLPGAGAGEDAGTSVGLEELRFRAGDMLLPLDDLAPDRGTERASTRGAQIARSQYNRTGKIRGTRDGGLRAVHPPRSLPLVTGEETPTVESAESRIVSLRVTRGDVDIDCALPLLDTDKEPEHRARLISAMVQHYAPAMPMVDWLHDTAAELRSSLRDQAAADVGLDVRHAESVADLAAGWRAMLDMATARGALTVEEKDELWSRAWAGLIEAKGQLVAGSSTRTPADRVRELLTSAMVRRDVGLLARNGGTPDDPERYGWEEAPGPAALTGTSHRLPGTPVGWTDGERVWLQPGAVFPALVRQASGEHDPLTYTRHGLGQALADADVIRTRMRKGVRATTVPVRLGTNSHLVDVWEFNHSWLFPADDDEESTPTPPPAPTAPPAPLAGSPEGGLEPPPANGDCDLSEDHDQDAQRTSNPPAAPAPQAAAGAAESAPDASSEPSAGDSPAGPPEATEGDSGRSRVPAQRHRQAATKYRGVAAVCEPGRVWLARPGADPQSFEPPAEAPLSTLLDGLADLQLGHIDGRGQYWGAPEAWGQAWITTESRRELGWPSSIADAPGKARKVAEELTEAGWQVLGEVGFWTRIVRDGARLILVIPDWLDTETSLGERDASACELANRLARFAHRTGIVWQWSPASTAVQLAAVTRPRLLKRDPQALPKPAGRPNREQDFSWQRSPAPDEELEWVHLYDFNALYLGAASSLPLAWGEYEHIKAPTFDPNRPGYWKVRQQRWTDDRLPDPFVVYQRGERETMILTTPALKIATDLLDWDVEPIEGWLAVETLAGTYDGRGRPPPGHPGSKGYGRLLDKWASELSRARLALLDSQDPADQVVLRNVKAAYAHGVGRFDRSAFRPGKGERLSRHPLWRPDWRHAVVAQARYVVMRRILEAARTEERYPLAVMTDGIVYASDNPDPAEALPTGFTLGERVGQVKHEGTAPLEAVLDLLRDGDKPTKTVPGRKLGLSDVIRRGGVVDG